MWNLFLMIIIVLLLLVVFYLVYVKPRLDACKTDDILQSDEFNFREGYKCICNPGYEGDNCEKNIDECVNNECKNASVCMDGINGYTCDCPPGYEGNMCQIKTKECVPNICNNGTCEETDGPPRRPPLRPLLPPSLLLPPRIPPSLLRPPSLPPSLRIGPGQS